MCINCWEDYKSEAVINDRVLTAKGLIDKLYAYHEAGGNLHVVVDDWNLDSVESCLSFINEEEDPIKKKIELEVYNFIVQLSETELASALAMHDGFLTKSNAPS